MVLVVFGHTIVLMPSSDLKSQVYDFVYYFHIPAFVLVTGYLSRSFRYTRRHLLSLVTTLAIPYVVFELLMALWRVYVVDNVSSMDVLEPLWLNPHWPMWYLVALIMWRLVTPVFKVHWLMVPVAVAISLVGGYWNLETFDVNRALGFLPFFVLGLHLPEVVQKVAQARWSVVPGLLALWWIWELAEHTDDHWSTQWLYHRTSYGELGATFSEGVEIRAQLLAVGLVGALAVLTLIPRRKSWLSAMGAWTMGVYLLHGFVVRYLEFRGYEDWMPSNEWLTLAITVAVAVAIALVLAWPPIARQLAWLVDPVNTYTAFRKRRRDQVEQPA